MYIYILRCCDDTLYTGIALDIRKRLRQHTGKIGGGARYTRSHGVSKVEAIWETEDRSAARKMEYAIKKLKRTQKEELIHSPDLLTKKFITSLSVYQFKTLEIIQINDI